MGQFHNIEWVSPPSETPDQHGNHWYTVKIAGRNVQTLAKNPPQVGQVYGEVSEETSKAGKKYYRLRRQQVPEGATPEVGTVTSVASGASEMLKLLREIHEVVVPQEQVPTEEEVDNFTEEDLGF